MRGVGATPPLRATASAYAALVAPTPRIPHIQKLSSADISLICPGYEPDQFAIRR